MKHSDGIIVNFYMDLTDKVDASNTKMKFTYNGKTSEATPVSKKVEGVTYDYTYSCELFATEMNETITAEFYEGDEKLATYTYSVKAYCDNTLTDESNTTNDLINAMMTYGGMSQLYFGQENPVSSVEPAALDTDELDKLKNGYLKQDFTYDSKYNPNGEKIRVYGMTLVLYAETALRAGFSLGTGYAMSDFVFTPYMKSGDTYVAISNEVKSGVYRDANGNVVPYFEIRGINPAKLSENYKIVVSQGENTLIEIPYSPFTYINNKLNDESSTEALKNVVTAMYRYNEAAKAYTGTAN